MKTLFKFTLIIFICHLFSCETSDPLDHVADSAFQIINNNEIVVSLSSIDSYDFSSHILYLLPNANAGDIVQRIGYAEVRVNQEPVYSLSNHPSYYSYLPFNPFINEHASVLGDFGIQISYIGQEDDPRQDPRIIDVLKRAGKYRGGLNVEIKDARKSGSNKLELDIALTNPDGVAYYHLDPEKMGMPLFSYFTNGPFFFDDASQRYVYHNMETENPSSLNQWDMAWMSVIPAFESKNLTLEYEYDEHPIGETVDFHFSFPGLSFQLADRSELDQESGRVWLGEARTARTVLIK